MLYKYDFHATFFILGNIALTIWNSLKLRARAHLALSDGTSALGSNLARVCFKPKMEQPHG